MDWSMLLVVGICFLPALLKWAAKYVKLIEWLSPAFFCYVLGIVLGNVVDIPKAYSDLMLEATVVLAIPMMLFSADVKKWFRLARPTAISFGLFTLSICTVAVLASIAFVKQGWIEPLTGHQAASMASSVWTGGTQNMGAVKVAIGAPESLFLKMVPSDLMVSGVLLLVIFGVGQRLAKLVLPAFQSTDTAAKESLEESSANPFFQLPLGKQVVHVLISIGLGLLALGIVAGLSMLFLGSLDPSFVMIGLTLAGMGFSMIPKIRQLPGTYETGEYTFLIFCVVIGSLVQVQEMMTDSLSILGFMACVCYGSILLHVLLSRFFKVDADTAIITIVAGICSSPFIGPVSNSLKNREIVISGLTMSAINIAMGNFVGLGIYKLLDVLGLFQV
ncbi:DUF819 family protein [Pontibacter sp. G13]|uniref:DUF819 family protein n=1 Tax=Pontibacter sp. G13 TaxID=3074898 RepID=UPI00288B9486|nr:DUF819 family protein [Pontibacter sp. G13]WNJ16105.1 DUF819 family protein [Pontibacter sp. G13]